ncbi:MAG: N-acetylmuramoyl-L-alanine amidase [Proteobacteria bacterium]|nr:N-acetylmuramoyl-L-alanine amidase [Pseudomonadota bacterium]
MKNPCAANRETGNSPLSSSRKPQAPRPGALLFLAILAALFLAAGPVWGAVVVLDPGHGGLDTGTDLVGGQEKDAALDLARGLEAMLSGRHRVVLTRQGDYTPPLADRAGTANHERADVFVSLHAAPRNSPGPARLFVWHWDPAGSTPPPAAEPDTALPWAGLQAPHAVESRRLAREAVKRLSAALPSLPVLAEGLPLAVLEGAAMPAILVEIPDPGAVPGVGAAVARALAQAVEDFLEGSPAP